MQNLERYLVTPNPNLSIILPGGCQASCEFCFWKRNEDEDRLFSDAVEKVLDSLPASFQQISITGGEPTLSPHWKYLIDVLQKRRDRWTKKVLNTNGIFANASDYMDVVWDLQRAHINHVNWSRHHYNDAPNRAIFGTRKVPGIAEMNAVCNELSCAGIDVTLNTVMGRGIKDRMDIAEYIKLAHNIGATAVCFRKEVSLDSNLDTHPLEDLFADYRHVHETSCPVCRSRTILFRGCPVTFKAGLMETAKDGIYELILHPNGQLTIDWAGKQPVDQVAAQDSEFGVDDVVDRFLDIEVETPRKDSGEKAKRKAHKKAARNTRRRQQVPNGVLRGQDTYANLRGGCGSYTGGSGCG